MAHPLKGRRAILSHIVLAGWSLIVLFPLWTMVINSFKNRLDIYRDPFGIPTSWQFESYATVFRDGNFLIYFGNTILVTISSIVLILLFGSMAAYAITSAQGSWSGKLHFFFIAGMMLPIKIGSIKLLEMVKFLGLLNSLGSLLPIYVAMGMPIAVLILTDFIKTIPRSIVEAAIIDGATRFGIYSKIVIRLIRPALGTVAIFNLVPLWNDLWFPLIFINRDESKTLILGVTRLFGQYQTDWSKILAALTLSAIPVLGLYLAMSRQFIRGLTAGAVKG